MALGSVTDLLAIGIDAELNRPLPAEIAGAIASDEELERIAGLPQEKLEWSTLVFSAKEAVFKAWFPSTDEWLAFDQATVHFSPPDQSFSASIRFDRLAPVNFPLEIQGRYKLFGAILLTSVEIAIDSQSLT